MSRPSRIQVGGVVLLGLCLTSSKADAGYTFQSINTTSAANAAAGEAQLTMTVQAVGTTQVVFRFANTGPTAMTVTDVYFDDDSLLGLGTPGVAPGVLFAANPALGNLLGGDALDPAFVITARFSAVMPPPDSGLNTGDSLDITFDLASGKSYADVVAALAAGVDLQPGDSADGTLRVGLFVTGFGNDDGAVETFLNEGVDPVPAPAAILLTATAIPVLGLRRLVRKTT